MKVSKLSLAIGWLLSLIPVAMMGAGGIYFFLTKPEMIRKGMVDHGYPEKIAPVIVALEVSCALIYLFPPTAVLGAILLTGYLGGAVATHVRIGETTWWAPLMFGVIAWVGLYLRDARVRALIPLRRLK